MTSESDYRDRMSLASFTDEDIESLISGEDRHPDLAPLAPFVAALRERALFQPRPGEVERTAIRAAAVVRSQLFSNRSTTLSLGSRSTWRRLSERTTVVLGSLLAVGAMSGVGLAADASAPGDLLYGIDLALEELGVGDGSIDERLAEAGVLMEKDDLAGAVELLAESISRAEPEVSVSAFAAAIEALEALSSDLSGQTADASADAQQKVSDLLEFIDANAGKGNGLDGKDFGVGVALIAQGGSVDEGLTEPDGPAEPEAPGNQFTPDLGGNGNSGNSNAGENGNGGSEEPPGNSGNSNAGGNGNGAGGSGNSNAGGNGKSNGSGKP